MIAIKKTLVVIVIIVILETGRLSLPPIVLIVLAAAVLWFGITRSPHSLQNRQRAYDKIGSREDCSTLVVGRCVSVDDGVGKLGSGSMYKTRVM